MKTYYLTSPLGYRNYQRYRPVEFNGGRRFPVDVRIEDDAYVIQAAVPGMRVEDLEIEILDDILTLRGEIKSENGDSDEQHYLLRELSAGKFSRSLRFSEDIDPEAAEASVENGLLTVRIPKAEEAKPKKIKVKSH